jgi:hypothetical protein
LSAERPGPRLLLLSDSKNSLERCGPKGVFLYDVQYLFDPYIRKALCPLNASYRRVEVNNMPVAG